MGAETCAAMTSPEQSQTWPGSITGRAATLYQRVPICTVCRLAVSILVHAVYQDKERNKAIANDLCRDLSFISVEVTLPRPMVPPC
jgi:hypothetical protein